MTNIDSNEYLEYPREFRLLEELKYSNGYINFGNFFSSQIITFLLFLLLSKK